MVRMKPLRDGLPVLTLLLLCLTVVPAIAGAIWVKVFTSAAIFALAARGASVLYARLGLVNLAQVALVGVGGWTVLRLNYATSLPFEVLLLAGAGVTALIGMLLALPALRMRGLYLALVTLMAAGAFQILFTAFQFPNGGSGFWGVALQSPGEMRRPAIAAGDTAYLRYVICIAALGMLFAAWHERARPGRAWAMIRQSEANAMAAGVNVTVYKVWAFGLAGFLAGLAGGLLAGALNILDARSFAAGESILLFALCVVGGVYGWLGAVLAGILYRVVPALLNDWGLDSDLSLVLFGAALLHALMTAPRGIAGQLSGVLGSVGSAR
ncbi:branched-chain amino acid ABC transporter permease [Nitratireductor sp. XY-223]|uniref:branched-chain amino acid ABC transporter permease n=1 Tax=Nitratireductor sp. XY-223 TaxID=2561926 RepID=UPI0010AAB020|nr:branched-chain amino acid ABC transporter permease [Nitratireductor sp. XY-223]